METAWNKQTYIRTVLIPCLFVLSFAPPSKLNIRDVAREAQGGACEFSLSFVSTVNILIKQVINSQQKQNLISYSFVFGSN